MTSVSAAISWAVAFPPVIVALVPPEDGVTESIFESSTYYHSHPEGNNRFVFSLDGEEPMKEAVLAKSFLQSHGWNRNQ